MLCNIANIQLDDKEWVRIENKCKDQRHISNDDDLKSIIKIDEKILQDCDITFEQIEDLFEKIRYHFDTSSFDGNKVSDENRNMIDSHLRKYKIGGPGWYRWGRRILIYLMINIQYFA
jgi:hypothetical protein